MKKAGLRGQAGQGVTEAILILVLLMGFTFLVGNYFKNQQVFRQLITGPWQHLAGMLQNGVWAPAATGAAFHPNSHGRHIVITGEEAR